MKNIYLSIVASTALFFGSCYDIRIEDKEEWKSILDKYQVEGALEIYDNNKEMAFYYNKPVVSEKYTPGATFYTFSSIVGLETSTILDENKPIYWVSKMSDSVIHDKNINLREAYAQQNDAFFTQLHKEINHERMQEYLDSVKYGNKFLTIDEYWNNGDLLITLDEQIGLMKRIYFNKLTNVSTRSTTIVKSMMQQLDHTDLKLYYQYAPVIHKGEQHYWLVGFAESYNPLKNPKTQIIENVIHPYFFGVYLTKAPSSFSKEQMQSLLYDLLTENGIKIPQINN